jgi:hypothetical protein
LRMTGPFAVLLGHRITAYLTAGFGLAVGSVDPVFVLPTLPARGSAPGPVGF